MKKLKNKQRQTQKSKQFKHKAARQPNSNNNIVYARERELEPLSITRKQGANKALPPIAFQPLTDEEKQLTDDWIRSLDKTTMFNFTMLYSQALQHPTNGVAYLFIGRNYESSGFVPFCCFSEYPDIISYIMSKITQDQVELENTKFTCIEFYTGKILFNFYEKQEIEYRMSLLSKYMD